MTSRTSLDAQIVVAIHDPKRHFEDVIRTVLEDDACVTGVIAVLHNLGPKDLQGVIDRLEALGYGPSGRLAIVEHSDGIPSPAGPKNRGLDACTARWVGFADSDDNIDQGALSAWVAQGEAMGADAVLAPLRDSDGSLAPTPPIRVGRSFRRLCSAAPDRLYYRASPMGIYKRGLVLRSGARMTEKAKTGEDIAFMAAVLSGGAKIAIADPRNGAYLIQDDAASRATTSEKTIKEQLMGLMGVLNSEVVSQMTAKEKKCLALKLLRRDLLEIIMQRMEWGIRDEDSRAILNVVRIVSHRLGNVVGYLSRSEVSVLTAVTTIPVDTAALSHALESVQHYRSVKSLIPNNPLHFFAAQGPFRYRVASKMMSRRLNKCYGR